MAPSVSTKPQVRGHVQTSGCAHAGFPRNIRALPLSSIHPGTNDRKAFGADDLEALASSIAEHGLAQPITVRPSGQIVAGERRYRAHVLLAATGRWPFGAGQGWCDDPSVDVIVRDWDDRRDSAVMLAENLARVDLRPWEEAEGYAARMAAFGLSEAEVAGWAGVSTYRVTERLRLLRLTSEARAMVETGAGGALPIGHAARMADLDSNRQALALAAWAESGGTIHRAGWGEIVGRLQAEQDSEAMFSTDSFLRVAEMVEGAAKREPSTKALRRHLQAAVRAMEAAGVASELCEEIRSTWSASWSIARVAS